MVNRNAAVSAARARVDGTRKKLGFPSQEYLDSLNDKQQEGLFELLDSKDKLIGASVVSLAKSLYTSQARFVFELLQNCEDNHYSKALSRNETPQVTFHLYRDRVVQECNEDGFDEVNLAAICNIGKSSKTASQTYIGEKGIGFKSVFMVAHKAYIQSGDYSFFFKHRPKDNGMGMIAPQWQESEEYLGDHSTRITLSLHDHLTESELAAQYQMIREQFEKIHEAILLFMTKLKNIRIVFYNNKEDSETIEKTIAFSVGHTGPKTTVTKTTTENGTARKEVKHYFASTYRASGLAKNNNRDYTLEDLTYESYSYSNVTLAFPLDETDEPLLFPQWVFAYLPACRMGFKFIIQADFETQANREGIVMTAARNKTLMLGIAKAFVHAIQAMREVPSLRFKWMRYLPKENDYPWDETWSILLTHIRNLLKETHIMEPAEEGRPLKYLRDSRQHSAVELDEHGKPLLPDKVPTLYVSLQYKPSDLHMLHAFGLNCTSMGEIIDRVKSDLERPFSRTKYSNNDGQSRIARLLTFPFTEKWLINQTQVKKLKMLQLHDQTWCAAEGNTVYFPTLVDADITIPNGLGWNVLGRSAELLPDKKKLLTLIGVMVASIVDVRKAIANIHGKSVLGASNAAALSLAAYHLRFLYLTDHLSQDHVIYHLIDMFDSNGVLCNPRSSKMYIWNRDPYGVASLLQATASGYGPGSDAPGRKATFLHKSYFEETPEKPEKQSNDWKEWLHVRFNIQRMIPLLNRDQTGLSDDCKYLARYRPDRFLVFLQSTWNVTMQQVNGGRNIVRDLLDVPVVCCRGSSERAVELEHTYLPLQRLTDLCGRFLIEGEFFPFLKINRPLSHGTSPSEWEALGNSFGLGYNDADLVEFLLNVLEEIEIGAEQRDAEPHPKRIYDLYLYLQAECRQSKDFEANCEKIRQSTLKEIIFVPTDNEWDDTSLCVWEAPRGLVLRKKYSLSERFGSSFKEFDADKAMLADLFVNMLGISPTCTWLDLVDELRFLKANELGNFESVYKLYECLARLDPGPQVTKQMKTIFAEEALIYDSTSATSAWYNTPRCLWSSATNITGMFAVNTLYDDLKSFFVKKLGVQTRTVGMVYKKLVEDTTGLPIDEIKTTLMVFSALLERESGDFDPIPVREKHLFPVMSPSGELELRTATEDFVIRDRQHLSDDFAQKAPFLDFSMDSVRRLRALIDWVGLEKRYISNAIKEVCSVDISSTRPIGNIRLQISQKAHALTRIAASFDSPRLQGNASQLYRLFKASQTLETNSITSRLIVTEFDPPIFVEKESANLYIPDHATELKIYLTDDEIEQESCFNAKLPRRLAQWIMSEPDRPSLDPASPRIVAAVQSVLSVSRRALSKVLDEHGIVQIDVPDEPETTTLPLRISEPETVTMMTTEIASQSLRSRSEPVPIPNRQVFSDRSPQLSETTTIGPIHSPQPVSDRASYINSDPSFEEFGPSNITYMQLLLHVVEGAAQVAFPTCPRIADNGFFELDGAQQSNYQGDRFNLRQYHKLERDKRVGAAGELFVFELLLRLLPNFERDNWKSNIRHYVHQHPDYADITSWNGRETSDIVYHDSEGMLTNLLIDNEYFDGQQWTDTDVEYYIEVKSSTDGCKAPFYMSHSQYNRMHEYSTAHPSFQNTKKLYIIFRVYDLTRNSIGLNVLVDPARLAGEGRLSFTADTWSGVIN